ncbi:hypothetical protein [Spirulina sp. 06S082]|uniref:hypothetical protein n=1 Tax=Spirulina sp. 06S082 TaxID=3110248 RepID=UPI002B1FA18F|nr:hypothetical protein [Spirulina sp. 06S082]MEA5468040.1 hypothetical protein [Spirulina sp. 06S082]
MPKYTVEEVLDIIKALNPEDQKRLQKSLVKVWDNPLSPTPSGEGQQMMNTFGNMNVGGSSNQVNVSPAQNRDGQVTVSPTLTQTKPHQDDLQEALQQLEKLKQEILTTSLLDALEKTTKEAQVRFVEEELKKPNPDRNLVGKTVSLLKLGLEGVQTLAEPVQKVASLIARVWGIAVL